MELIGNYFHESAAVNLIVGGNAIQQWGTAVVDSNLFFGDASSSGALRLEGGWGGSVRANNFYNNANGGKGVMLVRYPWNGPTYYSWPVPSVNRNRFTTATSPNRYSLYAPSVAYGTALPTSINATHNFWGVGDSGPAIESMIYHYLDNTSYAYVSFQPWDLDGGGGGGCPYVLAKTDSGYEIENSILGLSEVRDARTLTSDALPLQKARPDARGVVRVRIAELESDKDFLDQVGLLPVEVGPGEDLGTDDQGNPVVFKTEPQQLAVRWFGKREPFISPISPGSAYSGEAGDSLEAAVPAPPPGGPPIRRRIVVSLVPKPEDPPPNPSGVVIRISPDDQGDRWVTLPPIAPREYWSSLVVGDLLPDGASPKRIRLVWRTKHTLGAIGLATVRTIDAASRPLVGAVHSSGQVVTADLASKDGRTTNLLPGESVDLDFETGELGPNVRLVLTAFGRYERAGAEAGAAVPQVYSLAQNRPNPFNPETSIGFGLPVAGRVSMRIYDVAGRLMRTIADRPFTAGFHVLRWNGRNEENRPVASGVYFYELSSGSFRDRKRMVHLK